MKNHNLKVVARRLGISDITNSSYLREYRKESKVVGFEEGSVAEALFILFMKEEKDVILAILITKAYLRYLEEIKNGDYPILYCILKSIHGGLGHRVERSHSLLLNYLDIRDREYKKSGLDATLKVG